jgi:hypothetical protein
MAPLLRNALRYAAVAAILCSTGKAAAIDCPSGELSQESYVLVADNGSSVTQVDRTRPEAVLTARYIRRRPASAHVLYQGLVPLAISQKERRIVNTPRSDLKRMFPLNVGETHRLEFERTIADGKRGIVRAEYKVLGEDRTRIGACVYDVFKIEHSEAVGRGPMRFINTEWYAPDLRMIIGREYRRMKGDLPYIQFYKYDTIFTLKQRP